MGKACTYLGSQIVTRTKEKRVFICACVFFLFFFYFVVGIQVITDEDATDNFSAFHRKLLEQKIPPPQEERFVSFSNNVPGALDFQKYYINDDLLKDSLVHGTHRKNKGYLTIGIPTVNRRSAEYIHGTLDSIVDHTSVKDKEDVVVVIMAADKDSDTRAKTMGSIFNIYRHFFESGFFQVIEAPQELYPSLEKLDSTFNDKPDRVAWRSKQNLDYSFMFAYSRNISEYFVMIEDDVISAPGFVEDIRLAVVQQTKTVPEWYCLEFSHLGFIGKLFRSSDLKKNAIFFYLFFRHQPGDMLLPHLYNLNTQFKRIVIKPTLFQHMGYHSSLGNVRGKVKDKFFKKNIKKNK